MLIFYHFHTIEWKSLTVNYTSEVINILYSLPFYLPPQIVVWFLHYEEIQYFHFIILTVTFVLVLVLQLSIFSPHCQSSYHFLLYIFPSWFQKNQSVSCSLHTCTFKCFSVALPLKLSWMVVYLILDSHVPSLTFC